MQPDSPTPAIVVQKSRKHKITPPVEGRSIKKKAVVAKPRKSRSKSPTPLRRSLIDKLVSSPEQPGSSTDFPTVQRISTPITPFATTIRVSVTPATTTVGLIDPILDAIAQSILPIAFIPSKDQAASSIDSKDQHVMGNFDFRINEEEDVNIEMPSPSEGKQIESPVDVTTIALQDVLEQDIQAQP